jgi:hypothetical protein
VRGLGFRGVVGESMSGAGAGVYGQHDQGGVGVSGFSGSGIGVKGEGENTGVYGLSEFGTGVIGESGAPDSAGVSASNSGGGDALRVNGRSTFDRSGQATVPAGTKKVMVTGVASSAASLVLATVQSTSGGSYVKQAVPNVAGSSFTVFLNKAPTVSVPVAWFVVN